MDGYVNFNLWDCVVIVLIALGLWWGSKIGFAAQLVESGTVLIGVVLGIFFYVPLAHIIASSLGFSYDQLPKDKAVLEAAKPLLVLDDGGKPIGLISYSACFWSFVLISGGFWLLTSPLRVKAKIFVLKIPPAVDTILGVTMMGIMALVVVGFLMMIVGWLPSADLQEKVEQNSFSGRVMTGKMPQVYYHARNPNAKSLIFSERGEIGTEQQIDTGIKKSGGISTQPKK